MRSILRATSADGDVEFARSIDAAVDGDSTTIRNLIVEFEPGLVSFARRQGAADVDGVVNATLSDAFRNLGDFRARDRRAFRAYLYRILRCRITDELRRSYARPRTVADLDDNLVSDLVDDDASSFDERVVDQQLVDDILEQLTDDQREVLEMRVLTGLSIKETAYRTGRSEVAVKAMQRRALRSLRSLIIAAAVVLVGYLGIRLFTDVGRQVTVVENAPADSSPQGFDGRSTPPEQTEEGGAAGDDELSEPPLVVDGGLQALGSDTAPLVAIGDAATAEAPIEAAGPPVGPDTADPAAAQSAAAGGDRDDSGSEADGAAQDGAGSSPVPAPGSERRPLDVPVAPLPDSMARTACSVLTDGSPAVGEVAFVTYDFTGPYELFRGTSVDIVGPGAGSALIPGVGDPSSVGNGGRFPFEIGGNMMWKDGFAVQTTLAGGEIKTRCDISTRRIAAPCRVTTDGEPAKGDTAAVDYRATGPYGLLEGERTYIIGWSKKSVLDGDDDAPLRDGVSRTFTIDGFMFKHGPFEVRTAFAGGAHAVCQLT